MNLIFTYKIKICFKTIEEVLLQFLLSLSKSRRKCLKHFGILEIGEKKEKSINFGRVKPIKIMRKIQITSSIF